MRIDLHVHLEQDEATKAKLDEILTQVKRVFQQGVKMSQELDDLQAQVEETKTAEQSAIVLLQGLKQKLDEAGTDPAKLKALRDALDESEQALAAAVVANTPAG